VVSGPLTRPRATSPTELAEAVDAQIREAREVLRADAAAAGVDPQLVDAAVDAAIASYAHARVHAFIGILVERDVRSALQLRTHGGANGGPGSNPPSPASPGR
jgi:hypothetical protein